MQRVAQSTQLSTAVDSSKLREVGEVARQEWRADAACVGARMPDGSVAEFVDVGSAELAEYLIRRWCHRCEVISQCAEAGDAEPRQKWSVVYGGQWRAGRKRGGA